MTIQANPKGTRFIEVSDENLETLRRYAPTCSTVTALWMTAWWRNSDFVPVSCSRTIVRTPTC